MNSEVEALITLVGMNTPEKIAIKSAPKKKIPLLSERSLTGNLIKGFLNYFKFFSTTSS